MSEIKKHYFKVPENIKEMSESERKAFAYQLRSHMVEALKKDKEENQE